MYYIIAGLGHGRPSVAGRLQGRNVRKKVRVGNE